MELPQEQRQKLHGHIVVDTPPKSPAIVCYRLQFDEFVRRIAAA